VKHCPRCNRELRAVKNPKGWVCSGCNQAPAYCPCDFQRTMIEDEEFVTVEDEPEDELVLEE